MHRLKIYYRKDWISTLNCYWALLEYKNKTTKFIILFSALTERLGMLSRKKGEIKSGQKVIDGNIKLYLKMHHIDFFMKSLAPVPVRRNLLQLATLFFYYRASPPRGVECTYGELRFCLYRRNDFLRNSGSWICIAWGQHLVIHGMNAFRLEPGWKEEALFW